MKSILVLLSLAAAALATETTGTTTTTSQTAKQSCLNSCTAGDVNCQAICVGVPHPGETQMNAATDCVAQCDQGDGSTAASNAYAKCQAACISSYIITSGTAVPTPSATGVVADAVATSTANASSGTLMSTVFVEFVIPLASSVAAELNATGNITFFPGRPAVPTRIVTGASEVYGPESGTVFFNPNASVSAAQGTNKEHSFRNIYSTSSASGSASATGSTAATSSNGAVVTAVQYGGGLAGLILGAFALL